MWSPTQIIRFNGVSADLDENGNDVINCPGPLGVDEALTVRQWLNMPGLFPVDPCEGEESGFNVFLDIPHQILRWYARIRYWEYQRRVIYDYWWFDPHPNDILVTAKSGQAAPTYGWLVDYTNGQQKVFSGSEYKTHASIADSDVGADVVPWMASAALYYPGDMRPLGWEPSDQRCLP